MRNEVKLCKVHFVPIKFIYKYHISKICVIFTLFSVTYFPPDISRIQSFSKIKVLTQTFLFTIPCNRVEEVVTVFFCIFVGFDLFNVVFFVKMLTHYTVSSSRSAQLSHLILVSVFFVLLFRWHCQMSISLMWFLHLLYFCEDGFEAVKLLSPKTTKLSSASLPCALCGSQSSSFLS